MKAPIPVVTIGRQFGSGGRDVGRRVAELLGIGYYDKELLAEAARVSGMSADFIEAVDERAPGFLSAPWTSALSLSNSAFFVGSSPMQNDTVYRCQSDAILMVAGRGPCVIVGRTADYVLRAADNDSFKVLSVFVSASVAECARRIVARGDCVGEQQAIALINKRNKQRASYYNFYTDAVWGMASTYDLCVDTTLPGIEGAAALIAHAARQLLGL